VVVVEVGPQAAQA